MDAAPVFSGVGVALVTLFDDDGDVAVGATADLAARLVDAGLRAVVVAGSTGEAQSLSAEERVALLRGVRDAVGSGTAVLAGTGAPSARQAAAFTRDACDAGADAVLALSPLASAAVRPYYEAVAMAAGDVPVLAYHYPAVSPPGIPVEILADLPVVGVKDSTGSADHLLEVLDAFDDGDVYVGSSALLALAGLLGCAGAILALANAEPERCVAAFAGDARAQRDLVAGHLAMARGPFPHVVKALTAERWGTPTTARMG